MAAIDLPLPTKHRQGQRPVGWIAIENKTIKDQV